MTMEGLLAQLDGVLKVRRGWKARCPSHDDNSPSLSMHEGDSGILVRCWAGCSVEEIVAAMGLRLTDLFYDNGGSSEARLTPRHPKTPRFDWREYTKGLQSESDALWLRGMGVLEHARDLEIQNWSEEDLDAAMEAVASAHTDLARAECFNRIAVNMRVNRLRKETERAS